MKSYGWMTGPTPTIVSEDDGGEIVDSLSTHGLLSPVIDDWRLTYLQQYEPWFTFARDLNQSAMKLWMDHWRDGEGHRVIDLLPTAARVYGRAINHLAASVILCERGSAVEAAALARSVSEVSFWLSYMAREPNAALSDLEADDLHNFIDREKELQRTSPDQAHWMEQSRANHAKYLAKLAGRKRPSIKTIGQTYGMLNGYLKYRILSGFYGHLSHASLRHNLMTTGDKTGFNILGPHATEIPKALYFTCDGVINSAGSYAEIVGDKDAGQAFSDARAVLETLRLEKMPNWFDDP